MSVSALHDSSSAAYKKAQRLHQKATKKRNNALKSDWTPFRAAEKYYKARFPPPNLANVLDLATLDDSRSPEIESGCWVGRGYAVNTVETPLKNAPSRKAYAVPDVPGLVVLPSFLSHEKQRILVRWSLVDQAKHPNPTNLDIHYMLPDEGIWNVHLRARCDPEQDQVVPPRISEANSTSEPVGPRQLVNNEPATLDNFKNILNIPKPDILPSTTALATRCSELCRRLRWANIGWFYHWGTKQYDFAKGKTPVNNVLRDVCKDAVHSIDWDQIYEGTDMDWGNEALSWKNWSETYEPDAGIVNFYQTKDTLMAHVDRSEVCATAPLVSISLGNAAVFLIGGLTRDTEPIPILLRSGDVVIMSGPACRRAYHGVPRILDDSSPPHLLGNDSCDWEPYAEYMRNTRININVRQVFPRNFEPKL